MRKTLWMMALAVAGLVVLAPTPAKAQITSGQAREAIDFAETWEGDAAYHKNNLNDNIAAQISRLEWYNSLAGLCWDSWNTDQQECWVDQRTYTGDKLTSACNFRNDAFNKYDLGVVYLNGANNIYYNSWPKDWAGTYNAARQAAQDNYPVDATGAFPDSRASSLAGWSPLTDASITLDQMEIMLREVLVPFPPQP